MKTMEVAIKLSIIIGCLFLLGCQRIRTQTTAYTNIDNPVTITPESKLHVLEPKSAKNPLAAKEVRQKIAKHLQSKGYQISNYEDANYFVIFDYGIGNENEIVNVISTYQWYRGVGVGTSTPITTTTYDRWFVAAAFPAKELRNKKDVQPIWVGEVKSRGTSSDMRLVVNYLVVAAFENFGKDTGTALSSTIYRDDMRAKELEKSTPAK